MNKHLQFLLKTLFFFVIFVMLLYFFSYLGRGQGSFIYNEF
ncbi:teichoic acid D-Ala incorporation-associated protein DltX [Streptococcus hyointestinalis]|uniref:D-Ala-teichoic acid biosynthesis protein n=1 Tax=Streptococcus hyointestinalis TaxID=1337 RepID=A0A380KF50_9STRE|nr:teichoic acid D-Ala incorporation-associated protein DltX [Streptococcus hyointestinalis]MCI6871307.1 teichoic acid D-Ala incorporation-associated protein DltX [Streptococcus hyointestinalis]MDD6385460.1 teichoic acid D-Ala incorporation-associated protein DltX [Streptococcus hyointestinalis]MDD7356800.1 teichoic acid D-Ala incorporation-associated protein DltX [Streptococcus hyointestinalis]MDY4553901.1 teichoic acid D-Ala incorporation-associated protein DltX [Streptococcus hyointestinalis